MEDLGLNDKYNTILLFTTKKNLSCKENIVKTSLNTGMNAS